MTLLVVSFEVKAWVTSANVMVVHFLKKVVREQTESEWLDPLKLYVGINLQTSPFQ